MSGAGHALARRRFALYRQRSPDEEPSLIGDWDDLGGPLEWLQIYAPQQHLSEGERGRLVMYEVFDWQDGSRWCVYAQIAQVF